MGMCFLAGGESTEEKSSVSMLLPATMGPIDDEPQLVDTTQMTDIDKPHDNDVLCGRGVTTNRHPGNEKFRSLVGVNKEIYVTSSKRQKKAISQSIVDAIRSMKPPGRFLEKNPTTGLYNDVGDQKAIEKTSQALRDGAASLRKQLSEDMRDPDFLSAVFDTDEHGNPKEPERKEQDKKPEQTTCTDLDSIPDIVVSAKEKAKEKEKPKSPMKKETKMVKKGHRRVKSNPDAVAASARRKSTERKYHRALSSGNPRTTPEAVKSVRRLSTPSPSPHSYLRSASFDQPSPAYSLPSPARINAFHESFSRSQSFDSPWGPRRSWSPHSPRRLSPFGHPSVPPPGAYHYPHAHPIRPMGYHPYQSSPVSPTWYGSYGSYHPHAYSVPGPQAQFASSPQTDPDPPLSDLTVPNISKDSGRKYSVTTTESASVTKSFPTTNVWEKNQKEATTESDDEEVEIIDPEVVHSASPSPESSVKGSGDGLTPAFHEVDDVGDRSVDSMSPIPFDSADDVSMVDIFGKHLESPSSPIS